MIPLQWRSPVSHQMLLYTRNESITAEIHPPVDRNFLFSQVDNPGKDLFGSEIEGESIWAEV